MTIEDVQGKKEKVRGGGTCIYCGSDGGEKGLRSEHIMPYSLGGDTELLDASCTDCESITSYLDGYLANATFKHVRVHGEIHSRSGHPKALPTTIIDADGEKIVSLAVSDHPFFLHMPVWGAPGILRRHQLTDDFGKAYAHVWWYIPPNIRENISLDQDGRAQIRDTTSMPNLRTFARAIAKIAYCNAILRYGLGGFRSLAITDIILGKYQNIPSFVGGTRTIPPPPDKKGILHKVEFRPFFVGRMKFIIASIRLFAHNGTEESGMPIYHVVCGAEGQTWVSSRRPAPKLPRIINL